MAIANCTVDFCPPTKSEVGLQSLHEAEENTCNWLNKMYIFITMMIKHRNTRQKYKIIISC